MSEFFSFLAKSVTAITTFKFAIFIIVMAGFLLIYSLKYLLRKEEPIKNLSAFIKIFVSGGIFLLLAALSLVMFHEPENEIHLRVENLRAKDISDEILLDIKVYNGNNSAPVQGDNEGNYHLTSHIVRDKAIIRVEIDYTGKLRSGVYDAVTKAKEHPTQEYGP